MFYVGAVIAGLIIGFVLLGIGGIITPKNDDRLLVKFLLMVIGVVILVLTIGIGVYDDAGKPISLAIQGDYKNVCSFRAVDRDRVNGTIYGVIIYKDINGNTIRRFVVVPEKMLPDDLSYLEEGKGC